MTPQSKTAAHSLAAVIYLMYSMVSAMLLYGVVKGRPSYLMPFFWIKLCDFFFSLPTFLSTLYGPHHPYGHHPPSSFVSAANFDSGAHTPSNPGLMDMRKVMPGSSNPVSHSLLVSTCIILFKGYFLCVVWKCYRYLKMREMILPLHLHSSGGSGVCSALSRNHDLNSSATHDVVIPPGLILPSTLHSLTVSPPDYETATKTNGLAPPDYETAVRQQQQQEMKFQEQREQLRQQQESSSISLMPPSSIAVTTPSQTQSTTTTTTSNQSTVPFDPPSPAIASCSSFSGSSSTDSEQLESIQVVERQSPQSVRIKREDVMSHDKPPQELSPPRKGSLLDDPESPSAPPAFKCQQD